MGFLCQRGFLGKAIAVMYRFPKEPYNGQFQDMTSQDVPTFFDRVSDEQEARVVDFLNPTLSQFLRATEKMSPFRANAISERFTKALYGALSSD